jgi:hypothetical protein
MALNKYSLSHREGEGVQGVSFAKGEGATLCPSTLPLPQLRCSLPLRAGEGI